MSEANANPASAFTCLLRLNREQGSGPGDSGVGTGQGERPRFMGTIFKALTMNQKRNVSVITTTCCGIPDERYGERY